MEHNNNTDLDKLDVKSFLQSSSVLYKQGDFAGCVEECNRAIKQGWRNGGIYNIKAIALTQLQQYDEAMEAIDVAIKLAPDNAKIIKNRSIIEVKMRETRHPETPQTPVQNVPIENKPKSIQTPDQEQSAPIYVLDGTDGIVHLYSDRVAIERSNKLLAGKKKSKEVFISNISEVKIKGPVLTSGYIRFILIGEAESKEKFFNVFADENTVSFLRGLDTAEKIYAKINELKQTADSQQKVEVPKIEVPQKVKTQAQIPSTPTDNTIAISLDFGDMQSVPIETRIENAIPSEHGLYPHEILLLSYAHKFYTDKNSFAQFWWHQYGIKDVQKLLSSLKERGFLKTGDLHSALERQTASTLRELLRQHNKKTTGFKKSLIQRTLDEIPTDRLNQRFPGRLYVLTDKGEEELEAGEYVIYAHHNRNWLDTLDVWSLNLLVHEKPYMPYRDKIWEYLIERCLKYAVEKNYGLYRNCRYHMYLFLKEMGNWKEALNMLIEVVFLDLSDTHGCSLYSLSEMKRYAAITSFTYGHSLATTAPGVISAILECQEKLEYSDEDLKTEMTEYMKGLSVPIQIFTIEECIQIIFFERDRNKQKLIGIYANAERRFKQRYS